MVAAPRSREAVRPVWLPALCLPSQGQSWERVRYRQSRDESVLDLPRTKDPHLEAAAGAGIRGAITTLGGDGFTVSGQAEPGPQDYQVFDPSSSRYLGPVFEVKHVSAELTKQDTGTTFLLTQEGLYLIRRPIAESENRRREQEWFWQHTGG